MKIIVFIIISGLVGLVIFTFNDIYGSAECPENTKWNGVTCINDAGEQMVFIKKSKEPKEEQKPIIITKRDYEILTDLLVIKPEKIEVKNLTGKALEQKILYDNKSPNNLERNNYYFNDLKKWSIENAELTMNMLFDGRDIQNKDFGKNTNKQIEYKERLSRSEDPVLQSQIIKEKIIAEQIFLKNWGNYTND